MEVTAEYGSIIAAVVSFSGISSAAVRYNPQLEGVPVPSLYVPPAEQLAGPHTVTAGKITYAAYFRFTAENTQDAAEYASKAVTAIVKARNLIPLRSLNGDLTGSALRIRDPKTDTPDIGVAVLTIEWVTVLNHTIEPGELADAFIFTVSTKGATQ